MRCATPLSCVPAAITSAGAASTLYQHTTTHHITASLSAPNAGQTFMPSQKPIVSFVICWMTFLWCARNAIGAEPAKRSQRITMILIISRVVLLLLITTAAHLLELLMQRTPLCIAHRLALHGVSLHLLALLHVSPGWKPYRHQYPIHRPQH